MARLFLPLVLLGPLLALSAAGSQPAVAAPRADTTSVHVAVANLREGSLRRHRTDLRAGHDRMAFARRLLARPGPVPDVVLLQEVLGTAGRVAAALNAVQRTRGGAARYAVATTTSHRFGSGRCDGVRRGRFSVLRSSAILVNTTTVTGVQARGALRTWGRWSTDVAPIVGRGGRGCTEHPWVRLTVARPGGPQTATLLDVHVAPRDTRLKNRAIGSLRRGLSALTRQVPSDVTVLGGDFNLPRCGRGSRVERTGCHVRPAHRALLAAGFRDAVRAHRPSGPSGVNGVSRRIDFLYALSGVTDAWWDRCYQAYRVSAFRCARPQSAFTRPGLFVACQRRAHTHGRAGGGCSAAAFQRYYSDHPIVTARLR